MPTAPLRFCAAPSCGQRVPRGYCPAHSRAKDRARPNAGARLWYMRARWRRLRVQILQEQPLCPECHAEGQIRMATEVHHKLKHHGDEVLFYDRANLEGLCHFHHGQHTGRGE